MNASGEGEAVLPSTETDDAIQVATSRVTEEQWRSMKAILDSLLNYRDDEGNDPSKIFHKRVNRRNIPDYYDVIKEPMAFSNLKQKIANREYLSFAQFVRDNALIWHNAHTYNRPDAGAYQDASILKELMEAEFKKLVSDNIITEEIAEWPDLGEIPPVEDMPEEDDDDVDDDDEDEDEEADESEEDMPKRRRGPGRPPRRDTILSESGRADSTGKKKRGRPPKVDTPMEARIKNVLKGLRKLKNGDDDNLLIYTFEKLPEKTVMPEYYATIKRPMAIDQIKKSLKRKRYRSVDDFMKDVDIMFENAKIYNEDDSQIYQDAVELQKEAHRLAEIEKARSDTEFVMEEGRKPRPGGIMHNGELWKVGDWVHITNANDTTKPIIAQIYRTWEDSDGQEWVNACWYYRPEQTVHQYEKHFYPMEVVKTGQYRDHPIDDVIDKCYVMFFTRFPKGRPRGLAHNAKVYVCEARYNEEKHRMNKIKTWASCLPDEIRDQDYEMDFFPDGPRRNQKVPSPLLYMLEQGNVTEEVPQLKWGEENAPPIIGGIHKGPREDNQTPPPDSTPEPTAQTGAQPQAALQPRPEESWVKPDDQYKKDASTYPESSSHRPAETAQQSSSTQPQPQPFKQPASPAPAQYTPGKTYSPQLQGGYTPQAPPPSAPAQHSSSFLDQYSTPSRSSFSSHVPASAPQRYAAQPMPMVPGGRQADTFILNDLQNAQIPEDLRRQFLQDEFGHVLFFTKPPLIVDEPERKTRLGGHTVAYRAAKLRREHAKRQRHEAEDKARASKKPRREDVTNGTSVGPLKELAHTPDAFETLAAEPIGEWLRTMEAGTTAVLRATRGGDVAAAATAEAANRAQVAALQAQAASEQNTLVATATSRHEKAALMAKSMWKEPDVFLDDIDARLLRY